MTKRYLSKVIVITGASDGIGAELARQFSLRGHHLVLAARTLAKLEAVAADCRHRGAQVLVVPTDVTVTDQCRRLMERCVDSFGRIDVLVNNAGVSMHAPFDTITDFSTFETLWRVNCLGTVNCTRFAYPYMRTIGNQEPGQIVGICSLAGKTGVPGRTTYCASKYAQAGFLEALRIEADEYGIGITIVYPGVVATELRRRGLNKAGEIAGVSELDESGAMSVEECARQIVRAIRARKRELVLTRRARIGMWLKLVAPQLVDRMARATLKRGNLNDGQT